MHEIRKVCYADARAQIANGDLLLFQGGRRLASLFIRVGGRSPYSHAAIAAWENDELRVLEVTQYYGGRERSLLDTIKEEPGNWDVYKTNPTNRWVFSRLAAVNKMREFINAPYGWLNLAMTALPHLALLRFFYHPNFEDDRAQSRFSPFCSEAAARACVGGGVDPVPNLADRFTEPGDLARSLFFRYCFTLIP